jgi:hypothetical protein
VFVRREFLINDSCTNKVPSLQFFKLILVTEAVADKFIAHSIPLYISRIIERDDPSKAKGLVNANFESELSEALKLLKHWVDRFPKKLPQFLAFSFVALAELPVLTGNDEKRKDHLPQHIKILCIEILLILSAKNTKLCCICGGFSLLLNSITDPSISEKSYDIISKMLIFMNDAKNRDLTASYIDFKKIFHVLTDLDNVFLE